MKPYPEGTTCRDPDGIAFNKELSSARVQVKCAFGLLKNWWRILQKHFDSNIEFMIKAAIACAVYVLCNICLWNSDAWDNNDDEDHKLPGNILPNAIQNGDGIKNILKDLVSG